MVSDLLLRRSMLPPSHVSLLRDLIKSDMTSTGKDNPPTGKGSKYFER